MFVEDVEEVYLLFQFAKDYRRTFIRIVRLMALAFGRSFCKSPVLHMLFNDL